MSLAAHQTAATVGDRAESVNPAVIVDVILSFPDNRWTGLLKK
jgi:hypothetical protein